MNDARRLLSCSVVLTRVFSRVCVCVCCLSRAVAPAFPLARQSTAEDARGEESRERDDASVMANATDPLAKSVRGMDPQVRARWFDSDEDSRMAASNARASGRVRARER